MSEAPRIHVEPLIPTTTEYSTVTQVRAVMNKLDSGVFREAALLVERMLWNPRLRAVVETRFNGLIATKIRFEPGRDNRDGRRAAREFEEDWPAMAPAPVRKQNMKRAILLGIAFAQRALGESPSSGRQLFQVRPYWPGWGSWHHYEQTYKLQAQNEGLVDVPSPALGEMPPPAASPWMVFEPFGASSFREGLVHAAWRPWLGHDWSMRDQARASEKHGIGVMKFKYPRGQGDEHKEAVAKFERGLRTMGTEGRIPLEQRDDGQASFDVEPFEFNGSGFDAIDRTLTTCAVALAILFLGHNLTTEVKSGGSYAAAGVGEYIRDDVKYHDGEVEWATLGAQLARPYCLLNYGDPELAPRAVYVADSTTVTQAMAQMYNALAQAITLLRQNAPQVDIDALCERFRLPMALVGKAQVQAPPEQQNDAGEQQNDEPAQPDAPPQQGEAA